MALKPLPVADAAREPSNGVNTCPEERESSLLSPSRSTQDFSFEDLELLHQYDIYTRLTLDDESDELRRTWKVEVPKLAFEQPYLMHSLLALAALHLSSLTPHGSARYLALAVKHHTLSLTGSRAYFHDLSEKTCNGIFVFSSAVAIYALALPLTTVGLSSPSFVDELAQVSALIRGSVGIVKTGLHWVKAGPLKAMMRPNFLSSTCEVPADVTMALDQIEESIRGHEHDEVTKRGYLVALQHLQLSFRNAVSSPSDRGVVLSWLGQIPPAMVVPLSRREPLALVLVAHYAVLLHDLRDVWWCKSWGVELLDSVSAFLHRDWWHLIEWPKRKIAMDNSPAR